jgi:hypothetical protein
MKTTKLTLTFGFIFNSMFIVAPVLAIQNATRQNIAGLGIVCNMIP